MVKKIKKEEKKKKSQDLKYNPKVNIKPVF